MNASIAVPTATPHQNPDPFTKFPKWFSKSLRERDFAPTQVSILLALSDLIYGFHRDSASASLSYIAEEAVLDVANISRGITQLLAEQVISREKGGYGHIYRINPISMWLTPIKPLALKFAGQILNRNFCPAIVEVTTPAIASSTTNERKLQTENKEQQRLTDAPSAEKAVVVSSFFEKTEAKEPTCDWCEKLTRSQGETIGQLIASLPTDTTGEKAMAKFLKAMNGPNEIRHPVEYATKIVENIRASFFRAADTTAKQETPPTTEAKPAPSANVSPPVARVEPASSMDATAKPETPPNATVAQPLPQCTLAETNEAHRLIAASGLPPERREVVLAEFTARLSLPGEIKNPVGYVKTLLKIELETGLLPGASKENLAQKEADARRAAEAKAKAEYEVMATREAEEKRKLAATIDAAVMAMDPATFESLRHRCLRKLKQVLPFVHGMVKECGIQNEMFMRYFREFLVQENIVVAGCVA